MNRNFAFAALFAVAISGNAMADDITIDTTPFVSTRTHAEVQAELVQFRKSGISPWSIQYNPLATFKSSVSSEQVTAEYLASRGEVAAFNGEDSGSSYLSATRAHDAGATLAGRPWNTAR
ncbi:MAG: hypothetical protein K0S48_631 [Ramlibacter sp.]|jgi:hypothetical protein|nr:hypothetical protein [Ramlibacter sp.]MCE3269739.1 hypothetical protein [Ramlibacter sp.]